ncbi:MAG TPA: rhomboid family intramembrane serine protease [Xanthobacteraceae bacterium]|jgi:membrane associated rhomboid family serine protease
MVFPLYDEQARKRVSQPYVTWGLVALNVAVFIAEVANPGATQQKFVHMFGFTPAILAGDAPNLGPLPVLLTPLTDMFIHLGWDHLLGNMLFLLIFGDNVEDALGHLRYLAFYVACSFASDLAYFASSMHSTVPAVGASGAISGVVAAYVMIRPCAKVEVLIGIIPVALSAYWVIGLFALTQFWNVIAHTADGVAYWAHIGGLIAGACLLPLLRHRDVVLFECVRSADAT